jgi:hypothetical protein
MPRAAAAWQIVVISRTELPIRSQSLRAAYSAALHKAHLSAYEPAVPLQRLTIS